MSEDLAPLRVSLVQSSLYWHDPNANRARFAEQLAGLAGKTDLIVLPEMFTTGFTMAAQELAERPDGPTADWLRAQALRSGAAIAGSIIVEASVGDYRNRLLLVTPEGALHFYDKRHLFRMGGENRAFAAGSAHTVIAWRGLRIGLLVCYDLRFPVWSRRRTAFDYDLLLYVANWPHMRANAWTQLLRARAIENQAFVVGVNRVGRDGHGVPYQGDSAAIDFLGQPLLELGADTRCETVSLDGRALAVFREKFPAQLDADSFEILP